MTLNPNYYELGFVSTSWKDTWKNTKWKITHPRYSATHLISRTRKTLGYRCKHLKVRSALISVLVTSLIFTLGAALWTLSLYHVGLSFPLHVPTFYGYIACGGGSLGIIYSLLKLKQEKTLREEKIEVLTSNSNGYYSPLSDT